MDCRLYPAGRSGWSTFLARCRGFVLKYEAEGGPSARSIVDLLREHSRSAEEDVDVLVQALILNWLIGGTDAHAKNYSVLIGEEGRARLAPLYDVASALPYGETAMQKLKLAMKVGGKYRLHDIGPHQWAKLATELQLETDRVMEHLRRARPTFSAIAPLRSSLAPARFLNDPTADA